MPKKTAKKPIKTALRVVPDIKKLSPDELDLSVAREFEAAGDTDSALSIYLRLLKKEPLNDKIYDRLMILYRKLKEPKKEMEILNQGMRKFEERYAKKHKTPPVRITQLSSALLKATGLADKKGKSLYAPEPLGRWQTQQ